MAGRGQQAASDRVAINFMVFSLHWVVGVWQNIEYMEPPAAPCWAAHFDGQEHSSKEADRRPRVRSVFSSCQHIASSCLAFGRFGSLEQVVQLASVPANRMPAQTPSRFCRPAVAHTVISRFPGGRPCGRPCATLAGAIRDRRPAPRSWIKAVPSPCRRPWARQCAS
jgi:hypothetical protein